MSLTVDDVSEHLTLRKILILSFHSLHSLPIFEALHYMRSRRHRYDCDSRGKYSWNIESARSWPRIGMAGENGGPPLTFDTGLDHPFETP